MSTLNKIIPTVLKFFRYIHSEEKIMNEVCRFKFKSGINKEIIEEQIALAIISAESVFGQPRVRLCAGYAVSGNKAVIDISSGIGEHVAEVFTGLMIRKVGENSFTVERIKRKDDER